MDDLQLAALADSGISACVGEKKSVTGTGEVAEVARLVLGFPDRLVRSWRGELELGNIEVDGMFCHATPKAYWLQEAFPGDSHSKRSPELCDLLIVLDNYPSKGGMTRRALIIQAKQGTQGILKVAPEGPSIQRYMFANWPDFTLVGYPLPPLDNVKLAPSPSGSCKGSRYALVDTSVSPGIWSLESAQAQPIDAGKSFNEYSGDVSAPISLGTALVQMLKNDLGARCTGQWSTLVKHLLELARVRTAEGRQPSGVKSAAKGEILAHAVHASTMVHRFGVSDPYASLQTFDTNFMTRLYSSMWHDDVRFRATLPSDEHFEPRDGFGVIHVRLKAAKWKEQRG